MKKPLSLISVFLVSSISLFAQDIKLDAKVSLYHILKDKSNEYAPNNATVYSANLKLTSPEFFKTTLSVGAYIVGDVGLTGDDSDSDIKVAKGLLLGDATSGDDSDVKETVALLSETYLKYRDDALLVNIGRQSLNTPMTKNKYSTMPNFYEAVDLDYIFFKPLSIKLGYITRMAYGSRSISDFGLIGDATATAGASYASKGRSAEFINMGAIATATKTSSTDQTVKLGKESDGVSMIALKYKDSDINLQSWYYFADDISHILYLEAGYSLLFSGIKMDVSAQYLAQDYQDRFKNLSVNNNLYNKNSSIVGTKISFKYNKTTNISLNYTNSNDASFFTPWGGDPLYTTTLVSRNSYRPDVQAYKIDLKQNLPIDGMKIMLAYADYGKSDLWTSFKQGGKIYKNVTPYSKGKEFDLVLSYKPVKNLLTKMMYVIQTNEFDGVIATDGITKAERTMNHLRFIAVYKF
ncbi:MAG: hypothetical protein U9P38_09265 [Campylobacterota bacterium]|nr:hypothetical protein [Campylobacterota bacterium]